MIKKLAFILALAFTVPALAQQPQQSPADQELSADWQSMMTAVRHVQQSLVAKLKEDADKQAALQKQIDELKNHPAVEKPGKK